MRASDVLASREEIWAALDGIIVVRPMVLRQPGHQYTRPASGWPR
jgi:hypothetical protein